MIAPGVMGVGRGLNYFKEEEVSLEFIKCYYLFLFKALSSSHVSCVSISPFLSPPVAVLYRSATLCHVWFPIHATLLQTLGSLHAWNALCTFL